MFKYFLLLFVGSFLIVLGSPFYKFYTASLDGNDCMATYVSSAFDWVWFSWYYYKARRGTYHTTTKYVESKFETLLWTIEGCVYTPVWKLSFFEYLNMLNNSYYCFIVYSLLLPSND